MQTIDKGKKFFIFRGSPEFLSSFTILINISCMSPTGILSEPQINAINFLCNSLLIEQTTSQKSRIVVSFIWYPSYTVILFISFISKSDSPQTKTSTSSGRRSYFYKNDSKIVRFFQKIFSDENHLSLEFNLKFSYNECIWCTNTMKSVIKGSKLIVNCLV